MVSFYAYSPLLIEGKLECRNCWILNVLILLVTAAEYIFIMVELYSTRYIISLDTLLIETFKLSGLYLMSL